MRTNKWTYDENGDPYFDADCEICGEQAFGQYYDKIDVTIPGDAVRQFLPGTRHIRCKDHMPDDG